MNKRDIYRAIRLSELAYEGENFAEHVRGDNFKWVCNEASDTQGFTVRGEGTLWVVIRGTEFTSLNDWLTNLDCRRQGTIWGDVHKGFYDDALSVFPEVYKTVSKAIDDGLRIIFTGHSQGAAVALQLFAMIMIHRNYSEQIFCVPVETPRGFSKIAAKNLGALYGGRIYPIENNNDVVCAVPPKAMGFCHIPNTQLQYLNRKGELTVNPSSWFKFKDSVMGYVRDIGRPGLDALKDHDIGTIKKIWNKLL